MQLCFVRGVGSPCSHARDLVFIAQVCTSLQTIAWGLGKPVQIHMNAKWNQGGDHANPDLAKRTGRAHAVGSKHLTTSRAARSLQAGRPQVMTGSCSTQTPSINEANRHEFRHEFCQQRMRCSLVRAPREVRPRTPPLTGDRQPNKHEQKWLGIFCEE
jgi:hypothetical protein